jgi:hypothetical protein
VLEKVALTDTHRFGDGEEFRPVPLSLRGAVRVERIEGRVKPRQRREVDVGDLPANVDVARRACLPPLDVGDETPRQPDPAAPGCGQEPRAAVRPKRSATIAQVARWIPSGKYPPSSNAGKPSATTTSMWRAPYDEDTNHKR